MSIIFLAIVAVFALAFLTVGAVLESFAPDLLDSAADVVFGKGGLR